MRGEVDASVLATLTAWCANQGVMPDGLRVGVGGLEELYLELTGTVGPVSAAAPAAAPARARVTAQARREVAAVLTNGEQLLLTLVLPLLALVALARTTWLPVDVPAGLQRVDVVVPGVLAVAVLSTAFTSQAIAVAFDRRYGVLRLLGTTPLGRGGLVAARAAAVLVVVVLQLVVLGGTGLVLGWRPDLAGVPAALAVLLLGTAALTALGLLLGGTVRAEGVLAVANLAWVLLVAGGGVLLPACGGRPARPGRRAAAVRCARRGAADRARHRDRPGRRARRPRGVDGGGGPRRPALVPLGLTRTGAGPTRHAAVVRQQARGILGLTRTDQSVTQCPDAACGVHRPDAR